MKIYHLLHTPKDNAAESAYSAFEKCWKRFNIWLQKVIFPPFFSQSTTFAVKLENYAMNSK
jgi:hypothetical protein